MPLFIGILVGGVVGLIVGFGAYWGPFLLSPWAGGLLAMFGTGPATFVGLLAGALAGHRAYRKATESAERDAVRAADGGED